MPPTPLAAASDEPATDIPLSWLIAGAGLLVASPIVVQLWYSPPGVLMSLSLTLLILAALLALPALLLYASYLADSRGDTRNEGKAMRPLELTAPTAWAALHTPLERTTPAPLHPTSRKVSQSADELIHFILRDFVSVWHTPLSLPGAAPGEEAPLDFPRAIEGVLRSSLHALLARAKLLDLPSLGVRSLLPLFSAHLGLHAKASTRLRGASAFSASLETEEVGAQADVFLARAYVESGGSLHAAVGAISSADTRLAEMEHLRKLVERALDALLPQREKASESVWIVARELVACTIMLPIVDALSDPDTLNGMLEQKAGAAIQEQKLIGRLREALDREQSAAAAFKAGGVSSSQSPRPRRNTVGVGITHPTSTNGSSTATQASGSGKATRSFASFIASIEGTTSLLEARRTKNDLAQQMRRTQQLLASPAEPLSSAQAAAQRAYLDRLQTALTAVETRIAQLGASANAASSTTPDTSSAMSRFPSASTTAAAAQEVRLYDVLRSPSALSHFLEFMEKHRRGLLVQFWLSVETFKGPLEDVDSASEEEDVDSTASGSFGAAVAPKKEVETLREDLKLFVTHYYTSPVLHISQRYVDAARAFLEAQDGGGARPSVRAVRAVRQSVLKAQREVEREMMEDYWGKFKRTDAYFSATEDLARERHVASSARVLAQPVRNPSPPPVQQQQQQARQATGSGSAERPTSSRAASSRAIGIHADLFGKETPPTSPNGSSLFGRNASSTRGLFDDGEGEDVQTSRVGTVRGSAMTHNLDLLIGGAGTSLGANGRAPLFREALFEEEDAGEEAAKAEEPEMPTTLRADRMLALEHALTSIIDEDAKPATAAAGVGGGEMGRTKSTGGAARPLSFSGSDDGATRSGARTPARSESAKPLTSTNSSSSNAVSSTTGGKIRVATAKRELRPAFKRSGTTVDSEGAADERLHRRRAVFGEDLDTSAEAHEEEVEEVESSPAVSGSRESLDEARGKAPSGAGSSSAAAQRLPLDLPSELARVDAELSRLTGQEEMLSALVNKAELTGASAKELRLLQKSQGTVERELRELRWERAQLAERHAQTALVPLRTDVRIERTTLGHEEDGKEFALYIVEVDRLSEKGDAVESGWVVQRRYAEFFAIHSRLKEKVQEVRALESVFPGKRLVGFVHAPFVDGRRAALEKYLKALVKIPAACESPELRVFLSPTQATVPTAVLDAAVAAAQPAPGTPTAEAGSILPGHGFVKSLFKGVTGVAEGIDDLLFGASMLEVISGRLASGASIIGGAAPATPDLERLTAAMQADATQAELKEAAAAGTSPFTEPICDLLVELFELKEKNNWLRRQALVIVLQQALGGTIERKLREGVASALTPDSLLGHLSTLKNQMWPGGKLKPPQAPRTPLQKAALRESAHRKLSTVIPDVAASFIGRDNARRGARRTFALLQNKRLNKHLVYTILDRVWDELFPTTL